MRNTGSVTQVDHPLHDDDLLISRTDVRGVITWANEGFCRVAGYSVDELVGRPHNLVRHPDMPRGAFADLWATVKEGKAWRGIVKNRCKNGDHYWVEADVTPIRRNGEVVGFLSIRGQPDVAERRGVEPVYAKMIEQEAVGGLKKPGRVARVLGWSMPAGGRAAVPVLALGLTVLSQGLLPVMLTRGFGVVATCMALWGIRELVLPVRSLSEVVRSADLHARVPVMGAGPIAELGRGFNIMQQRFLRIVREFGRQGRALSSSVRELRAANDDLSSRTEQQAANLEESAAGIEELSASVEVTARQARNAADVARQARDGTQAGRRAFVDLAASVKAMHEASAQVGEIIGMVDEIAFQTNLLALNAAVEAARAGEHGRGFAVVANEVRALALRSSGASKQIREIVSQSQERASAGVGAAEGAASRIVAAASQSEEVCALMETIADATREQSRGLGEMSKAVAQLDQITQRNAAAVEELAGGAVDLERQVTEMLNLVECFEATAPAAAGGTAAKVTLGGRGAAPGGAGRRSAPAGGGEVRL